MLKELVDFADRLDETGDLTPIGYRNFSGSVDWALDISTDPPMIREASLSEPRPNRKRTVAIRPLLFADYAYYVVGLAEEDKEDRAEKAHAAFVEQAEHVAETTRSEPIQRAAKILRTGQWEIPENLEPRDHIALIDGRRGPLFSLPEARKFWQEFVSEEFRSERTGGCSVCGKKAVLLQTLPEDVAIFNETCQITSFNTSAFESHGLAQTLNASLCYPCGARAAQALNHLTKSEDHRFRVAENQLAVFWTTISDKLETETGVTLNLSDLLAAGFSGEPSEDEDRPSLAQIRELLDVPWKAREESLMLGDGVNLAILSPNKARLVLREWIRASPMELRKNLGAFLDAQSVQTPQGGRPRSFGLRQLLAPLEAQAIDTESQRIEATKPVEPNLIRALLRTAYTGHPTPSGLEGAIVHKLQNPKIWKVPWLTHRAIALLTLARTRPSDQSAEQLQEETMAQPTTTERLDDSNRSPAYRCGRLLAVLEDTQRQAQGWNLNTTIVDRNFSAAATAPATTLPRLINLAETAHIPKIRKERGTDRYVRQEIESVVSAIHEFPAALDIRGQGDFALGFYHQRAEIQRRRDEHREKNQEAEEDQ